MSRRSLFYSISSLVVLLTSILSVDLYAQEETALRPHERWIWTELIAFDNQQPDSGVGEYLEKTGFAPKVICLMISSPDIILSHGGMETEEQLAKEYTSRDGHDFNPERQRQDWTNYQLRFLIEQLHERKIEVYLSVFAKYYRTREHREWIADHHEVLHVRQKSGYAWALNCLARLDDGSYFEDYFIKKLVETLNDYGFDGWHGADGWGPLSGPIHEVSFSDDMIAQFAEYSEYNLPQVVTQECVYDVSKLIARAEWILKNRRAEWSEFYADRWTTFWGKVVTALHATDKKAAINSAWGRAPFEALYRYGIDYQKIAATGVDAIIVETVAVGLATDPRTVDSDRHDDFLAMLMLMRACLPETKLIFLHGVHDVVEEWDAIHHAPMVLEREIYSLANVFHNRSDGSLAPSADGFLVCLGDGLKKNEWNWLEERWQLAFQEPPQSTGGATVVWSDSVFRAELEDYIKNRTWNTHRILFHLMQAGVTIQSTIHVDDIVQATGTLIVPNAHLMPRSELERLGGYKNGPLVLIGRPPENILKLISIPGAQFKDHYSPLEMWCGVFHASPQVIPFEKGEDEPPVAEILKQELPKGYWNHLPYRHVSDGFIDVCAKVIQQIATPIKVVEEAESVAIMPVTLQDGTIRIAIKNRTYAYARPLIDMGRPVASAEVLSSFPSITIKPKENRFSIRVPGRGITVVDVKFQPE
ncbi:hypothetical protein Pla110_39790 [Polystyrenella longa]|uniref:Beta-galactosidase trimerization domain protein n=1 Tax=Polystyrenella longa TaxID=2528007 RepID=A0A518CSS1_9PLAN|nr:hypothetical protein [Polystyrenella longa]QDU82224.1 hypothetical protein Pla110_39790 [Polystyrenella longa]